MSSSSLKKNPSSYLQHLTNQAKIKRVLKSATLHNEKEVREQNFQLFFSGANDSRKAKLLNKNNENSKSPYIRKVTTSGKNLTRKRWGTPTTPDMLKETCLNIQTTPEMSIRRLSTDYSFNSEAFEYTAEELLRRFKALDQGKQRMLIQRLEELEGFNSNEWKTNAF